MSASRHLEILARASTADLTTVALAKARLNISGSAEDANLAAWISEASDDFLLLTRRETLAHQQFRETQHLEDPTDMLVLACAPIEAGSISVTIDGVTSTDWELQDYGAGLLWREDGWDIDSDIVVTYRAGWLVPGQIDDRENTTAYGAAGQIAWTRPSSPTLSPYLFEATTAGTSGGSEPTWPTTLAGTVADDTVTWTARAVEELPAGLSGLAIAAVQELREGAPRNVVSERTGADSITFTRDGSDKYSAGLVRAVRRYRL